jgi:hypothetical protein
MSIQTPPKHQTGLPGYNLAPLDDQWPTTRTPRYLDPDWPPARAMPNPVVLPEPRSLVPGATAVVLLGVMLLGLSWQKGLLLGQLLGVFAVPLALLGLFKGGARKVIVLAALVGVFYTGTALPGILAPLIEPLAGTSAVIVSYLVTGLAGLVALLLARLIGRRVRNRFERIPVLSMVDRLAGVVIGAAEGALLVLTLCWVCTLLEPQAKRLRDMGGAPIDSLRHQFAGQVIRVAREASAEPLGEFIRSTNPIEKIPALKKAIDDLNETGRLNIEGFNPELLRSVQQLLESQNAGRPNDLNAVMDAYQKVNGKAPRD